MRVVFCGNPEFAILTLDALLGSSHSVAAVVCSPDKPRGRGRKVEPLPVKRHALDVALPVLQPVSLKDEQFLSEVRDLSPDCLVVVAFRILPRELFALPRLGSLNVHPSLLPKGRGPAPIRWTLIRGETETGISIIQLTEQIDGGGILKQVRVPVLLDEDFGSLHARLARLGAELLIETLNEFERGAPLHPIVQDESAVTKAPKLFAVDFLLDWSQPARELHNRIRALSPSPGAIAKSGEFRLKILKSEISETKTTLQCGQILTENNELAVGTRDGTLRLKVVQPDGKRVMSVAEYLRGRPVLPRKFD